jgi:hypothetical protein
MVKAALTLMVKVTLTVMVKVALTVMVKVALTVMVKVALTIKLFQNIHHPISDQISNYLFFHHASPIFDQI